MLEGMKPPVRETAFCKVQFTAEQLSEADRQILLSAADDTDWTGKALSRALKERGIFISDTTLLRHRQRHCQCG
jgi:hypothetical protein